MNDVMIYETGNGGDVKIENGDVVMTDSIFNQPYLSHFGGNVEKEKEGENIDWWGNYLFSDSEAMVSEFERRTTEVTLNSNGRTLLERAAKNDIKHLEDNGICSVESSVSLVGVNRVFLSDKLNQSKNKNFKYIWDATKDVIIEENTI